MTPLILYVDDDAANLDVFEALCDGHFDVVTASGGEQALELLRTRDIAVLLTDQRMPKMSGTELAEVVSVEFPEVVRYLVTAYSDLAVAVDAINRGQVRQFLRKPWNNDELRAKLREGLDDFLLRRRLSSLERRFCEVERVYSLGVVAASIAHELRNPMTALFGHLDLASILVAELQEGEGGARGSREQLSVAILRAQEAARRMTEIMRGIEMASRPRGVGNSGDAYEAVDLTIKMLTGEVSRSAQLVTRLAAVPTVGVSTTRIGQMVVNLVVNALQALPPNRGCKDNLIEITLEAVDDFVELTVSDNGPGISAEHKERIFDPFFTTKDSTGTGLGLAISKQIAEEAGGTLVVGDSPHGGARFMVRLPATV